MINRSDIRELLRLASQIHVEPYVHDLVVRVGPGVALVFGFVAVTQSVLFTIDLISAFSSWTLFNLVLLLVALVVSSVIGGVLVRIGHRAKYADSLQPEGWPKSVWLEAVDDFNNSVALPTRRKASRYQTNSLAAIGFGTACIVLLLIAIVQLATVWAWVLLISIIGLYASLVFHKEYGNPSALWIGVLFGIATLIALFQIPSPWPLYLALAIASLRAVHVVLRRKWHRTILERFPNPDAVAIRPRPEPRYLGPQGASNEDEDYTGSRYRDVRAAVFENPYYRTWGDGQSSLPVYKVTLESVLRGVLPYGRPYPFREAAQRTVDTHADLRWGANRRGFRRLLHPNGVCLFGEWEITEPSGYTGYFGQGKKALLIARYSTCCTETRRGRKRSLSMAGKLYPTTDPDHRERLRTASFITQEDLGGERHSYINDAEFRNAPDTTSWRRGLGLDGLPVLSITGLLFTFVDTEAAIRQLYEIAELGKPADVPTKTPTFMRILVDQEQPRVEGGDLDFRDEVLAQIYDRGDERPKRKLVFQIEVSDTGKTIGPPLLQRRIITDWRRIGRLVFSEAVASYNGDFVLHFHHPAWRADVNDASTFTRPRPRK